ncbi:MAG: 1-acyl-sn-glycerol-3-phosphate acyltransferase, partial [Oscillospiraceae bacterium]|nr:1-acyl-sn-glycerol-3-phosphate acyltransferase [Oscillospiraceae bacterium]
MKSEGLYHFLYALIKPVAWLFGFRVVGAENIRPGGAMVCSQHSHAFDPFLVALAFNKTSGMHFMAKKELFKNRLLAKLITLLGAFPIDRSTADVQAIKTSMKLLKSDKKLLVFPEGTRSDKDNAVQAKAGAVRIADRSHAPIYPVYLPRERKLFRGLRVVIGEPYYIEHPDGVQTV